MQFFLTVAGSSNGFKWKVAELCYSWNESFPVKFSSEWGQISPRLFFWYPVRTSLAQAVEPSTSVGPPSLVEHWPISHLTMVAITPITPITVLLSYRQRQRQTELIRTTTIRLRSPGETKVICEGRMEWQTMLGVVLGVQYGTGQDIQTASRDTQLPSPTSLSSLITFPLQALIRKKMTDVYLLITTYTEENVLFSNYEFMTRWSHLTSNSARASLTAS